MLRIRMNADTGIVEQESITVELPVLEATVRDILAEPEEAPKRTVSPELRAKMRELGRKGGQATVAKHGRSYMSEIGKRGFMAALERSGYSDAGHFVAHLIETGRMVGR